MQKPFNSLVVFVRNGVATPAFVVKSQLQADGREFLSLLYADPITGPQLVLAGATRKVGDVALSVPPLSVGANFGWKDLAVHPDDQKVMDERAAALKAGEPVPVLPYDEDDLPGVHGLPVQAAETDADKDARLANLAHQEPVIILPVPSAPEQLDEAQGAVEPGAPESPHAPGFASFHVAENEDGTLESHPGSYPENNPPSDSEREIAVQKSLAVQE